jgi:hypothetical protein
VIRVDEGLSRIIKGSSGLRTKLRLPVQEKKESEDQGIERYPGLAGADLSATRHTSALNLFLDHNSLFRPLLVSRTLLPLR